MLMNTLVNEREMPVTGLRALIVEDEPLGRRLLRTLLETIEGVEIVAEAGSAVEARQLMAQHRPDLVFMDIQMPGGSGIEMLKGLASRPEVIFVTGHPEFALSALELHPADFLTKPVSQKRLTECVLRVQRRLVEKRFADLALRIAGLATAVRDDLTSANALVAEYPDQILIRVRRRRVWLEVADIAWIEGASQYCRVHAKSGEFLLSRSLNSMEASLDPSRFFRIHRSAIVNASHVREVRSTGDGQYCLHLDTGPPIPVGRSRREALKRLVKGLGRKPN
jgi:two-component system LytT family response regulator